MTDTRKMKEGLRAECMASVGGVDRVNQLLENLYRLSDTLIAMGEEELGALLLGATVGLEVEYHRKDMVEEKL